jgi:hypothetical protein
MSKKNAEVLQLMYEAWNRRPDEIVHYLDPEIETHPGLLPPGEETQFMGHDGIRDWIRGVTDAWVAATVEPGERIELEGNRILAIDRWLFRGRDGIEVEEELPTIYAFRDGLVVRIDGFSDKAEAYAAAGVSE